ncbi:MAG: YjdF family protein [Lachnospiraceae bacterium]|nr:YjdF family protein [Lachnospiraceae bacterium]
MDKASSKLTVFFEDPFWVGAFERAIDGKLSVSKVVFGAEPKDYEVWDFVLNHYYELKFSPFVEARIKQHRISTSGMSLIVKTVTGRLLRNRRKRWRR